jgi:hypothetical protein
MKVLRFVGVILALLLAGCDMPVTIAPIVGATPRLNVPTRPTILPAATAVARATVTPRPTATPRPPTATPRPPGKGIELAQAVAQKLIEAKVNGNGLQRADVSVKSLTAESLDVRVLPGTLLAPGSKSVQTMVVRSVRTLELDGVGDTAMASLDVACAAMQLGTPGTADAFTIRAPQSSDLVKLVELPAYLKESFRVQQFAVWTITDNPAAKSFVGLGSFGTGSGPSAEELAKIKTLFVAAGINPAKYQALPR